MNTNLAFDDSGQPIATVDFSYPAEEGDGDPPTEDAARELRQETILAFLGWISAKGNARRIGARVALLAYLAGRSSCRTQRQLSKKLGLSTGRVSQILNIARRDLATLALLK